MWNLNLREHKVRHNEDVRVVVIRGNGKHFQGGADLEWLKDIGKLNEEQNIEVSKNTAAAIRGLTEFPKPTIALIHGTNGIFLYLREQSSVFLFKALSKAVVPDLGIPVINRCLLFLILFFFKNIIFSNSKIDFLINLLPRKISCNN